MTTLLALDTATEACSVALLHDGRVLSHNEVAPRLLEAALQFTGGHRQQAAQLLGISRHALARRLEKLADGSAEPTQQSTPQDLC